MDTEKVIKLIDKSIEKKENYNRFIIEELITDKYELIAFLNSTDRFYFMYIIQFLEDVILRLYSKAFMREFKKKIYFKYGKLSNINIKNYRNINNKYND